MGHRRTVETIKVSYGGQLEGLEITTRQMSQRAMRSIVNSAKVAENANPAEQAEAILDLCDAFGAALQAWNYEDEHGNPLPATPDVLADEPAPFVLALTYGWMDALDIRARQLQADGVEEATLPMQPAE